MLATGIIFLNISLVTFAMAWGGIVYQHRVEYPNWSNYIPDSIKIYREFTKAASFGQFFTLVMPLSGLSLFVALILLWNSTPVFYLLLALAGMVFTAGFTNRFFILKHQVLFSENLSSKTNEELKMIARQWRNGNYIRMIIMALTLLSLVWANVEALLYF